MLRARPSLFRVSMLAYPQEEPDFGVALSTSLVLFGFDGSNLQILLARSNRSPYQGALFLPSRYLNNCSDTKTPP